MATHTTGATRAPTTDVASDTYPSRADVREVVQLLLSQHLAYVTPGRVRALLPDARHAIVLARLRELTRAGELTTRQAWVSPGADIHAAAPGEPPHTGGVLPPVESDLPVALDHVRQTAQGTTVTGLAVACDWSRYRAERALRHGVLSGVLRERPHYLPTHQRPIPFYSTKGTKR